MFTTRFRAVRIEIELKVKKLKTYGISVNYKHSGTFEKLITILANIESKLISLDNYTAFYIGRYNSVIHDNRNQSGNSGVLFDINRYPNSMELMPTKYNDFEQEFNALIQASNELSIGSDSIHNIFEVR